MGDAHDLLAMVFSAPKTVLAGAQSMLDSDPGPHDASLAHQAIGIVQRESGDLAGAVAHLRRARDLALRSGSDRREADVCATLGVTLVQAGRVRHGLAMFDRAIATSHGDGKARVRFRLAGVLRILGRNGDAMHQVGKALPALRKAGDTLWVARAVTLRALLHMRAGSTARAEADFAAAETMFATIDHQHDSAQARHNRVVVAAANGDLPAALKHLDIAGKLFHALGSPAHKVLLDRCELLLAAGLADDAVREARAALGVLGRGWAARRAELLLLAGRASLAAGDPAAAAGYAATARRMFARQHRDWWSQHARLQELSASWTAGNVTRSLARQASRTAGQLDATGSAESAQAHLVAARFAMALGDGAKAEHHLLAAGRHRHKGPVESRVSGWLALALRAQSTGDIRGLRHACRRGLQVIDDHRLLLGAAELRAVATGQGSELARLAQRSCLRAGQARDLFMWTERWRSVTLAAPPARDDPAMTRMLASYRAAASDARLRGRQQQLERDIRERARQSPGRASAPRHWTPAAVGNLLEVLGDGQLLQIVEIDGRLHQVLCGQGRVRHFEPDGHPDVPAEVLFARSALRRLAYGRPGGFGVLVAAAQSLQTILIGRAMAHLGDGMLVVVPPAALHGVPWALLPGLGDRVLSIAPSASAWLRARTAAAPANGNIVLVRGPGLASGGDLGKLAAVYPHATVLGDGDATVARVLAAIEGSSLAHIAAHGAVRADNPLFSSIRLYDGPMTVHDVARLRHAPHRLILPSCESAAMTPAGADELLGLAAALLPRGTAAMIATADPVNDEATSTLMLAVHDALQDGAGTLAEALLRARRKMPADPVHTATAASFIAIGAG